MRIVRVQSCIRPLNAADRLPHHVAQVAGHRHAALARHDGGLDGEQLAADGMALEVAISRGIPDQARTIRIAMHMIDAINVICLPHRTGHNFAPAWKKGVKCQNRQYARRSNAW